MEFIFLFNEFHIDSQIYHLKFQKVFKKFINNFQYLYIF